MMDCAPERPIVIIGPPPTPNGDLHIGHIAGPYMSADVMRGWYRQCGSQADFVTGTDDSQTYVVSSARQLGVAPPELVAQATDAIRTSLNDSLIDVDGFAPFDSGYIKSVRLFLDPLYKAGVFHKVVRNLPYDPGEGRFLVEGLIAGECPNCLAASRGALCESCGQPLLCEDLRHPVSTLTGSSDIEFRPTEILVLRLEDFRDQIEAYYTNERLMNLRTGSVRIIRKALSERLPEFPITYPLDWGIPANYAEVPGQVFNAWAEGMAASMYCTAAVTNGQVEAGHGVWQTGAVDLIYFLGLDNVYFWGIAHLTLLLAHNGKYMLPRNYFSNHFYELEDEKISTSRGHTVLVRELLGQYSAEVIRFYLCWTSPETTERSFSYDTLENIARQHLVDPWNALLDATDGVTPTDDELATAAADIAVMTEQMASCMSIEQFTAAGGARCLSRHLGRLAGYLEGDQFPLGGVAAQFYALVWLGNPILKHLSAAAEGRRPKRLHLTADQISLHRGAA